MQETYLKLQTLLETIPATNSERGREKIEKIFNDYKILLKKVREYSDDYKRNAWGHTTELSDIQHRIYHSRSAKTIKLREGYFREAISYLSDDIKTLTQLIERIENFKL